MAFRSTLRKANELEKKFGSYSYEKYRDLPVLYVPLFLFNSLSFFLLSLMSGISVAGSVLIALGVLLAFGILSYACRNRSLAGMAIRDWVLRLRSRSKTGKP